MLARFDCGHGYFEMCRCTRGYRNPVDGVVRQHIVQRANLYAVVCSHLLGDVCIEIADCGKRIEFGENPGDIATPVTDADSRDLRIGNVHAFTRAGNFSRYRPRESIRICAFWRIMS